MNGWRIGPFLLYQGYRWMALCGLMGRCMARVSSALKSTAKLRLYFHICKRFRGKVLDSQVLLGKNLRRLWELFLVPQISQMHTDFFCVVLMFQVTQIWLSLRLPIFNSQIFYLFTPLNSHTDLTNLTDFFTFLLFHFFTFSL